MIESVIDFIKDYYNSMSYPEWISILVIIGWTIVIVILERIFPYTKGQKFFREGFFNDLALYTIAQSYILGIIIFGGIIFYIDNTTGLSRLGLFKDVPIWLQLVFFTITHDIYIYWMHRWHHDVGKGRNRNFATKLAVWDWIWGSGYLPRPEKPKAYRLKTYFPKNYFMQFLFAFMASKVREKK